MQGVLCGFLSDPNLFAASSVVLQIADHRCFAFDLAEWFTTSIDFPCKGI